MCVCVCVLSVCVCVCVGYVTHHNRNRNHRCSCQHNKHTPRTITRPHTRTHDVVLQFENFEEFRRAVCIPHVRPAIPANTDRSIREVRVFVCVCVCVCAHMCVCVCEGQVAVSTPLSHRISRQANTSSIAPITTPPPNQ